MKVAIHGSYFGYNFGDTLLCWIFNAWVKQNKLVGETVLPLANERNQRAILGDKRGLGAAIGAEAFIFCGGGYFSEASSGVSKWAARAFFRHLFLAMAIRRSGKPLAILGVGVGPVTSFAVRREILAIFEYAEVVAVRDVESAKMLREWGLRREVPVIPDAVAVSNLSKLFGVNGKREANKGVRKLVVHTSGQPSKNEFDAVKHVCEWALKRPNIHISLVTDGMPRRKSIAWPQAIIDQYPGLGAEVRSYDGNVSSMIAFLAESDGIVTTKLHVGIVGTILGVPVISVPHHSKTVRFFRQAGSADRVIDQHSADWRLELNGLLGRWEAQTLEPKHDFSTENPYLPMIDSFLGRRANQE